MRKIIVIGTVHEGLTSEAELFELLEQYQPSQILIEMIDDDIAREKIVDYPPEMQATYRWAIEHHVPVRGFDAPINILRSGVTKKDETDAIKKFKAAVTGLTWKDLNTKAGQKKTDIKALQDLVDPKKDLQRQQAMLENVNQVIADDGMIVIITGTGHLDFFEQHLGDATFPLRN